MKYHIQETIFPNRHTVSVMNPATGDFVPVAEIVDKYGEHTPTGWGKFSCNGIKSDAGETLEHFAAMVAKYYSPFERLRAADYSGNLFESL
jgi:hypothetical protein